MIISLANGLSAAEEQRHIDMLLRKIARAKARDAKRHRIDPFRPLIEQTVSRLTLYPSIGGPIVLQMRCGKTTRAQRTIDGWNIECSPSADNATVERFLWRVVSMTLHPAITDYVHSINARSLQVPIQAVKLRYAATNWGSCSCRGVIALSTPLLWTEQHLVEYVIVHELAHVLEMNHSSRFWAIVTRHCPEWQRARQGLRMLRVSGTRQRLSDDDQTTIDKKLNVWKDTNTSDGLY